MNSKVAAGLVIFSLVILLLCNQPLLGMASGMLLGIPAPFVYLGIIWVGIILAMAWFQSKTKDKQSKP